MQFEDKVAVITGGANGIGRSVAIALAGLGTDIVIADMDDVQSRRVCEEIENIGRRALAVNCDISKYADVKNLATKTISHMGKVDILMNNAGVGMRGFPETISIEEWGWVLGINLLGPVYGTHAFLPYMLKNGSGYIINTASAAGLIADAPQPFASKNIAYSTSKFGVFGFSEGLYGYLRPKGITVSVLVPGWVSTNIILRSRNAQGENENDLKLEFENMLKTPGTQKPDEVAQIVIEAMKRRGFIILTNPGIKEELMLRGQDIQKLESYLQDNTKL